MEAPQKDVENLCTDNLSDNDKTSFLFNAVDKFNKAIGQEEKYVCCASCGVINRSSECSLIQLGDEKLDHLLVNDEFSNWWKQLHPVYQAAHNVTECKENKIYATAYMLINPKDKSGYYCIKCQNPKSNEKYHTKFLDFDYGVSYVSN